MCQYECVKLRILPSGIEDSLDLYQRILDAGASMDGHGYKNSVTLAVPIGN